MSLGEKATLTITPCVVSTLYPALSLALTFGFELQRLRLRHSVSVLFLSCATPFRKTPWT